MLLCSYVIYIDFFFFFFQAEDGIRDLTVTGVQTCALPISHPSIQGPMGLYGMVVVTCAPTVTAGCPVTTTTTLAAGTAYPAGANPTLNPDRKSTRLNSSHSQISYAVFCLK